MSDKVCDFNPRRLASHVKASRSELARAHVDTLTALQMLND